MKLRYFALAAVVAALPIAAIAHEDGDGEHHRHHRHHNGQADKDGNITLDAVKTASAERFKRLDRNGDGVITPDEAPDMFTRPDANNDGKVTPDELALVAEARMKRADANGDGIVTKEERHAMRAKWKEAHPRADHDETPPPAEGAPAPK